ncbi:MAG TPA: cell wall hydrolase [Candidatus Scatomorpha merdigallinarum]|nr:cell wall hydrolase [Candidatus Scatomorpha merdigallinarum]
MKKAACFVAGFSLAVCLASPAGAVWDADYGESMIECALAGDRERGLLYERLRNAKIDALELEAQHIKYDDLVLLAQVIHTEAGSSWLPDEWRLAVGEVVLNRVASPEFPNTLEEVVFQPGQYSAADRGWFEALIPFRSCLEAALRLLNGERVLNDVSVVFQSGGKQGSGVALELTDRVYGSTYFCYTNHPELY